MDATKGGRVTRSRSRSVSLLLTLSILAVGCSSTSTNETSQTFESSTASSTAAPETATRCEDVEPLQSDLVGTLAGNENPDDRVMGVMLTYSLEHPDTFAGMWIDRTNGGVLTAAFTDDPTPHRKALLARSPRETDEVGMEPPPPITDTRPLGERDDVVIDVVKAEHTEATLLQTQRRMRQLLDPAIASRSSSGLRIQFNTVELGLFDPTAEDLGMVDEAIAGLPICIDISISPVVPDGPLNIIPAPGEPVQYPPGLGKVTWEFDPAHSSPTATDTELHLLATELSCAGGREMGDALHGPEVIETDTEILIAFAVESLIGDATCPSNPSTPVTVQLAQPIGDRQIRDGAE